MPATLPDPDDHADLRAALRRDAARVAEPAFDARLHAQTMRRIRALEQREASGIGAGWKLAFGAGLATALGIVFMLRTPPEQPHLAPATGTAPDVAAFVQPAPQGSSLAYLHAASHGQEAFMAMLARDATRTIVTPAVVGSFSSRNYRGFESDWARGGRTSHGLPE